VSVRIITGDCRASMSTLAAGSAQTCVTSPPYFGLRDYGHPGQLGLEATPDAYIAGMVDVFREVRRVLADDGTLWLNIGDSYFSTTKGSGGSNPDTSPKQAWKGAENGQGFAARPIGAGDTGCKPKDLIGIPWTLAFALRADGWYLRQDIIWHKPNPMPESVRDRCTKAHEYLFLLSKSERYYFDAEAIAEPLAASSIERLSQPTLDQQAGSARVPGKTNGNMKAVGGWSGARNRRSVWTVATQPFSGAHFATFPPALIEPCILAGSRPGDTVLDPFGGAGTTGLVADRLQRNAVLCELNPEYAEMARRRIYGEAPLFAEVA
jgi:DNA modification methylase